MTTPVQQNAPAVPAAGAVLNDLPEEIHMLSTKVNGTATDKLVVPTVGPQHPIQAVVSDEARQTLIASLLRDHREHGQRAVQRERNAARLNDEIKQDRDTHEKLRVQAEEIRCRMEELKRRIEARMLERDQESHQARQHRDVEEQFARAAVSYGAPAPSPAQESAPDQVQAVAGMEPCPTCGGGMVWDRQRNAYLHPLEGGRAELAGESCRRPAAGATQLATAQDAAEGRRA